MRFLVACVLFVLAAYTALVVNVLFAAPAPTIQERVPVFRPSTPTGLVIMQESPRPLLPF